MKKSLLEPTAMTAMLSPCPERAVPRAVGSLNQLDSSRRSHTAEAQRRCDRFGRKGYRIPSECDVQGRAGQWSRSARPYLGKNEDALHPHFAWRSCSSGADAV